MMKIIFGIALIVVLILLYFRKSYYNSNDNETNDKGINSLIKKQLNVDIPNDLLELWNNEKFSQKNRVFYYYSYRDLRFLSTKEINPITRQRIVKGSSDEYNQVRDNSNKKKYYVDFFQDPIMLSKFVKPQVKNFEKIDKCLVFASSVFNEHFIQMFYAFDKRNNNLGVWITKGEKSKYPSKIGNDLTDVFGDLEILKTKGFDGISLFNSYFYNKCGGKEQRTPFGIYPENIKKIINNEIKHIIWFNDDYIASLKQDEVIKLESFLSENGLNIKLLNTNRKFLWDRISEICKDNFDYRLKNNFMIIELENYCEDGLLPFSKGIVYIDYKEGRFLDKLGVLIFESYNDKTKYKFLKYEK